MGDNSQSEIAIFREFAEVCPLAIDLDSIEKREPREPDMLCSLTTGERIAFELVKVVDQGLAAAVTSSFELPRLLKQKCPPLPSFRTGAFVGVGFSDGLSRQATINLFPLLYEQLKQVPEAFAGEWPLPISVRRAGITHILISRGITGLAFSVTPAKSIGDPAIEQLQRKFGKQYTSSCPIELLMHYSAFQPCFLNEDFGPNLAEAVARGISASPFRRVWVYDCRSRGVWEYPCLSSDS